jgi:hypothetical protein
VNIGPSDLAAGTVCLVVSFFFTVVVLIFVSIDEMEFVAVFDSWISLANRSCMYLSLIKLKQNNSKSVLTNVVMVGFSRSDYFLKCPLINILNL